MLELPHSMRNLLVEQLDEFCESLDDTSDTDAIAESIVETIESVGQEHVAVEAGEIISQLEASGELETSLIAVLEDQFTSDPEFDYSGENLAALIEKLCEVDWLDADEDDDAAGFFGDVGEPDDDY